MLGAWNRLGHRLCWRLRSRGWMGATRCRMCWGATPASTRTQVGFGGGGGVVRGWGGLFYCVLIVCTTTQHNSQISNPQTLPTNPPGVFNAFRGVYEIKVWPQLEQTYLAVLSIRHPNVSSTFRLVTFHLTAATSPDAALAAATAAAAATQTTTAASGAGSSTPTLAQIGPVFNPLLNPQVRLVVTFPSIDAVAYGGGDKVLADFRAIVAGTAALQGPEWVQAALVNTTPVVVNATVRAL